MPFAEYIYIDQRRLNSYFEQISPPVKYDKVSEWILEISLTGPKAQGTQARMRRPFTEHEKITSLFGDLMRHSTEQLPNVMDAVRRNWPGDWAGFAFESLKARRVVIPTISDITLALGDIAVWVCEPTTRWVRDPTTTHYSGTALWRHLIEDYPKQIPENTLGLTISAFWALFRMISDDIFELDQPGFDKDPHLLDYMERTHPIIGPLRTIDTLYRVREVNTEFVIERGAGYVYAYPVFIAEHPSPFSSLELPK
ncbi:MAG: hypothetical protein ACFFCW_30015 [Candidatus Hodarchaeota archaeon]